MSEVKLRTVDRLKGCPMCGMKPAHGPTKVKHCQLHGEPYQDYRIWCRSRCSFIERSDLDSAIEAWNDRPGEASRAALISELVGALEYLIEEAEIANDAIDHEVNPGQVSSAINDAKSALTKAKGSDQ